MGDKAPLTPSLVVYDGMVVDAVQVVNMVTKLRGATSMCKMLSTVLGLKSCLTAVAPA